MGTEAALLKLYALLMFDINPLKASGNFTYDQV
jgi:hypothetical protein